MSTFLSWNRKSTAPAFPVLTVISFRPRTTRSLPADKSSEEIVLPSAVIVVQDSSRAWMTTVNSPGVAAGEAGAKSGDVLGTADGADTPVGELVVGKSEPDTWPDTGVAAAAGVGRTASLMCSRRRWLQKDSARATTSRAPANTPQGTGRGGVSALASRRLTLSLSLSLFSRVTSSGAAFSRDPSPGDTVSVEAGGASPEACM